MEINEIRRQNFVKAIEQLIFDVPILTDNQIIFGISRAASKLNDGHFTPGAIEIRHIYLPIQVKSFIDNS